MKAIRCLFFICILTQGFNEVLFAAQDMDSLWENLSEQQKNQLLERYKNQLPTDDTTLVESVDKSQNLADQIKNKPVVKRDVFDNRKEADGIDVETGLHPKVASKFPLFSLGAQESEKAENITATSPSQLFGYSLFSNQPDGFVQDVNVPIPNDYILGPGDNLQIQLFGQENAKYNLTLDRKGQIVIPKVGPINLAGTSFEEARQQLGVQIEQHFIGVNYTINMGELRTIQVYVLGEAFQPGAYNITALSTVSHALIASGGITPLGSLRNIHIKRSNKTIEHLDLYNMLINGELSQNIRLQAGDTVFIPSAKGRVEILGAIRRPAIYELLDEKYLSELIALAGGFEDDAFLGNILIEREDRLTGKKAQLTTDAKHLNQFKVIPGDKISVQSSVNSIENAVYISGDYQRVGPYEWREGLMVSDVVKRSLMNTSSDIYYSLLIRHKLTGQIVVYPVRLNEIFNKQYDIKMLAKDELVVLSVYPGRDVQLAPLVDIINKQDRFGNAALISVSGSVRYAGEYPYAQSMTLMDAINQAGGVTLDTDTSNIFLATWQAQSKAYTVRSFSLDEATSVNIGIRDKIYLVSTDEARDELLSPLIDILRKQATKDSRSALVSINGMVRFPGVYPLLPNMNVAKLIEVAGGYSENAFSLTAELTRYQLDQSQSRYIEHINFDLKKGDKTVLLDNDNIMIKTAPNWDEAAHVAVWGEVKFPGKYTIAKGDTLKALISRIGGVNEFAYLKGAVLLRKSLQEKEKKLLDRFKRQLSEDLAALKLTKSQTEDAEMSNINIGENLLSELDTVQPAGRLVIDFNAIVNGKADDIVLQDGDQLLIPGLTQEITVLGEVQYPTSHIVNKSLTVDDYIKKSGGLTSRADDERIYIIKASGDVVTNQQNAWFRSDWPALEPGDTIVVPYDVESIDGLAYWGKISQIVFQIGTAAASFKAIGVF